MPKPVPNMSTLILANAMRVFNAGARYGLKAAGGTVGTKYSKAIRDMYGTPGGGGRPYFHKKLGRVVISSAPGTPPAKQAGDLQDSVGFTFGRSAARNLQTGQFAKGGTQTIVQVFSTSAYAPEQEFGYGGLPVRPTWTTAARDMNLLSSAIIHPTALLFGAAERAAAKRYATSSPLPVTIIGQQAAIRP
jgi:hypothetical protein